MSDWRKDWPSCMALVDMVSFFASVEQKDFPELQGLPIAVLNGSQGSTIITASYEARDFGIKTGMKLKEARQLCPALIPRASRPERYVEISQAIMTALETQVTNECEIFSIDECFLDCRSILQLHESIEALSNHIRRVVFAASGGLNCSIGISEGKLTAKFAAKMRKRYTTILPANCVKAVLHDRSVDELCGIGKQITHYLNSQGIFSCGDLAAHPMTVLSKRFGPIGKRLYLTACGHDPEPLKTDAAPKSMGHGKVLPPATTDSQLIRATLHHQCEKLSNRLRENHLRAKHFFVGLKTQKGWFAQKISLKEPTDSSQKIWNLANDHFSSWLGEPVFQVQITATSLYPSAQPQLDLFSEPDNGSAVDQVKDQVNGRFGKLSLQPADTLSTGDKVSVISPSWRPKGSRQTI